LPCWWWYNNRIWNCEKKETPKDWKFQKEIYCVDGGRDENVAVLWDGSLLITDTE
jgi:hypothetical protein